MTHAPPLSDTCLGVLGLHLPEPTDRLFVQRVRAAVRDADRGARELMSTLTNEIPTAWCPRCKEETMPHDSKGTCLFCDTKLVDDEGKALHTPPAATSTSSSGRDALDRMDAGQPQTAQPPAAVAKRPCKTPGCQNEANSRYDRGPFAWLCNETCIPAAREAASARSRAVHAGRTAPATKPREQSRPPAKPKAVAASPSPGGASSTLAELAATYEEAVAAHASTGEELAAARTRLSEHPLFADLTAKAA